MDIVPHCTAEAGKRTDGWRTPPGFSLRCCGVAGADCVGAALSSNCRARELVANDIFQTAQVHREELERFGRVERHILGVQDDARENLTAEDRIDWPSDYAQDAHHRQRNMLD